MRTTVMLAALALPAAANVPALKQALEMAGTPALPPAPEAPAGTARADAGPGELALKAGESYYETLRALYEGGKDAVDQDALTGWRSGRLVDSASRVWPAIMIGSERDSPLGPVGGKEFKLVAVHRRDGVGPAYFDRLSFNETLELREAVRANWGNRAQPEYADGAASYRIRVPDLTVLARVVRNGDYLVARYEERRPDAPRVVVFAYYFKNVTPK